MSDIDDVSDTDSGSIIRDSYQNPPPPLEGPYLEIVEQPQSRGFRFRYACEGKSHGGLQGVNSRREKKSFPAVRINRYKGPARINISLVTDGKDPKPHAHELIGKNCQNGTCSVVIKGENMTVSFPNLGVRHATKKSVTKILTERIREALKVDRMMSGMLGQDAEHIHLTQEEEELARREAALQAKTMPLSVVRLRFQAYLQDSKGAYSHVLPAVISNPIYDSKAPCASVLKICRMDKVGGCCTGNEEVFLLCDKVQKDDIAVRFYEQDEDGNIRWEDYAHFAPHDVHRQYAIVFRTPCYLETNINRPVAVHVQLKRFSDGEVSDPKTFTYYPQQTDLEDIQKKRKKVIPHFGDSDFINPLGGGPKNFNQNGSGGGGSGGVGGGGGKGGGGDGSGGGGMVNGSNSTINRAQQFENLESGERSLVSSPGEGNRHNPVQSRLEADSCGYTETIGGHLLSPGLPSRIRDVPFRDLEPVSCVSPPKGLQAKHSEDRTQLPNSASVEAGKVEEKRETDEKPTGEDKEIDVRLATLARLVKAKSVQIANGLKLYASSGDVRHLLYTGRDLIAVPNEDGDNCLHLSVIHQQTEATKNLLSVLSTLHDSSALNDHNDHLQSPLYLAVVTGQVPLLNVLLSFGADCAFRDKQGNTFLHLAARCGYALCLEQFLNNWDYSAEPSVDDLNFEGFSALHLAVMGGHLDCVKLLLSVGRADINLPDARSGRTALHHAVDADNLAIVGHLILESGADVNQAAYDGNTALHMAVSTNRLGVSALLMAAEADPDAENLDFDNEVEEEDDEDDDCEVDGGDISDSQTKNEIENGNEMEAVSGQTPKDMAARNPKMLRILNGESYSCVSEKMVESSMAKSPAKFRSVCDSGISSIDLLSHQRSGLTDHGDLHLLDSMTRILLAKLLDPVNVGSDWKELAIRLGLEPLVRVLQFQGSPTKALLDNYEVMNGSSEALRRCLREMGRQDALSVIDKSVAMTTAD